MQITLHGNGKATTTIHFEPVPPSQLPAKLDEIIAQLNRKHQPAEGESWEIVIYTDRSANLIAPITPNLQGLDQALAEFIDAQQATKVEHSHGPQYLNEDTGEVLQEEYFTIRTPHLIRLAHGDETKINWVYAAQNLAAILQKITAYRATQTGKLYQHDLHIDLNIDEQGLSACLIDDSGYGRAKVERLASI